MKKKDTKFVKRLSQYGTLALAAAGVAEGNGQVVYTDVDPDFEGGLGSQFAIDFNDDGMDDIVVENRSYLNGYLGWLFAAPEGSNGVLGSVQDSQRTWPYALDAGEMISSGASGDFAGNSYPYNIMAGIYAGEYGNWLGVLNKYLGVEFEIDGDTHYGWVRLHVESSFEAKCIVLDYAYESTPEAGIEAGDMGTVGIDGHTIPGFSFSPNPADRQLSLQAEGQIEKVEIFSLTGQRVLQQQTGSVQLDVSRLPSGIYLMKVQSEGQTGVYKVVKR